MHLFKHLFGGGYFLALVALTSCSADEIETPASELYTREFVKQFGAFDRTQDWNISTQGALTVNVPSASVVKVYADFNGSRYLFGTFDNVQGTQALNVDLPKGVTDLIVRVNGRRYLTKVGGTINVTQSVSRSISGVTSSQREEQYWREFTPEDVLAYRDRLPEGESVNENDPTDFEFKYNLDKVTQNFVFSANQDFVIYPVYFQSSQNCEFGIYYRDPGETNPDNFEKHQLFTTKGNVQYRVSDDDDWADCSGLSSYSETYTAYRSKGYLVHVEPDKDYGFYIVHPSGDTFYSEAQFNELIGSTNGSSKISLQLPETQLKWAYEHGPHFGVYETSYVDRDGIIQPRMVLGAEDWKDGDFDLNDFIMYVDRLDPNSVWPPFKTEDIEESYSPEFEWIMACEDLGTLDDFDYNDVVFGVSSKKQRGDKYYVTVRALAAGGTLPVYLFRDDVLLCPEGSVTGEFHSWFGDYPSTTVINAQSVRATGKSVEVEVPADFTMAHCVHPDGVTNMGGFKVRVKRDGSDSFSHDVIEPPCLSSDGSVTTAPQMMCLPHTWQWPTERTHILSAYKDFGEWVKDKTACTNWHENVIGSVWTRHDIQQGGNVGGSTSAGPTGEGSLSGEIVTIIPWVGGTEQQALRMEIPKSLKNASKVVFTVKCIGASKFTLGFIDNNNVFVWPKRNNENANFAQITFDLDNSEQDLATLKEYDGKFAILLYDYNVNTFQYNVKVDVTYNIAE